MEDNLILDNTGEFFDGIRREFRRKIRCNIARSLEGELCASDNLDNSRGADEESELNSIPIHTVASKWLCQAGLLRRLWSLKPIDNSVLTTIFIKGIIALSTIE